jgi:tRNA dimethylallyltransferase
MTSTVNVAVVGATGSGKSALAHRVALECGRAEILCVDSMTVYKQMDIGTAKPSVEERSHVSYHLLDLVSPTEEFTVAEFQRQARDVENAVHGRNHHALFVGGTGLYGRVVLDNLTIPGQYPELRLALEERAKTELPQMYAELEMLDPLAASRMEATNERRIIRALEVSQGSQRPFSSFGNGLTTYPEPRMVQVGLDIDVERLDAQIELRFRQWMEEGLLAEVETLANLAVPLSKTARQAVGYKELLEHFEDDRPLEECVDLAVLHSRQLARRQRSWFRRDPRIEWFSQESDAMARIMSLLDDVGGDVGR